MKINLLIAACLSAASLSLAAANVTQINRYATVANKPLAAQVNPLLTVQIIHFPKNIISIGDAINYWIQYSSFRVVENAKLCLQAKQVLTLTLPQVDKNFGPLTIQDGLEVLVGKDIFNLEINPIARTINFKLKPKFLKGAQ